MRPRTILYAAVIALTGGIMLYALTHAHTCDLSVLHVRAPLYTQAAEGGIRNGYTLRFSNKLGEPTEFALEVSGMKGATMTSVVAKTFPAGRLGGPGRSGRDARGSGLRDDAAKRRPAPRRPSLSPPIDAKTGERSVVTDNFFGP